MDEYVGGGYRVVSLKRRFFPKMRVIVIKEKKREMNFSQLFDATGIRVHASSPRTDLYVIDVAILTLGVARKLTLSQYRSYETDGGRSCLRASM